MRCARPQRPTCMDVGQSYVVGWDHVGGLGGRVAGAAAAARRGRAARAAPGRLASLVAARPQRPTCRDVGTCGYSAQAPGVTHQLRVHCELGASGSSWAEARLRLGRRRARSRGAAAGRGLLSWILSSHPARPCKCISIVLFVLCVGAARRLLPCMLLCCCMRARAYGLCARVHVAAGRHPAAMGWLWDTLYSRSEPHHSPHKHICISWRASASGNTEGTTSEIAIGIYNPNGPGHTA